jgi:hypothetical protein
MALERDIIDITKERQDEELDAATSPWRRNDLDERMTL